jgi:hypothetical protein
MNANNESARPGSAGASTPLIDTAYPTTDKPESAQVDRTMAAHFLALLAEDESHTFQTFDDSKEGRKPLAKILHGTLEQHTRALARLNANQAGVFVTINKTDGCGRMAENIIRVRAVFADLDGAPLPENWGLEPHVTTASSPGRFHAYWSVSDCPLERFTAVQKAIAARFKSDPAVCDLNRVMRLPGFVHWKREPFLTQIIHENPAQPYALAEIISGLGLELTNGESRTGPKLGIEHDLILKALSAQGLLTEPIHGKPGAWAVLCPWRGSHTTGEGGTVYFEPHTNGYAGPGFRCLHTHCADRTIQSLKAFLGWGKGEDIPPDDGWAWPDGAEGAETDEQEQTKGTSEEEWPEPEPIRTELLPVEPLPLAIIPEPFRPWVKDVSHRMQVPPDFIATGSIAMAASVIGAGCGIRPKRRDDWLIIPNLWAGVIARPSVLLKTPSLNEALKPLYGLEATAKHAYEEASSAYEIELEAFKAQKEALKADMLAAAKGKKNARLDMEAAKNALKNLQAPEAPIWRRYRTNDTTVEKLGELLKENPRGLLIFRDELIGFLAALDREDRKSDRGFYLEAWNGYGSYLYDRIGRGTVPVENCCVSILGGIQPTKLLAYLHQAMDPIGNDGLLQRFQLLVYPNEPKTWKLVDRYPDKAAKDRAFDVLKNLAGMSFTNRGALLDKYTPCPYFQFGPKAQEVFDGWLGELEARIRGQQDDHPLLIEHLGKYRSLMPSLALIFHLIAVAAGKASSPVSLRAAAQAAAWCEYLESHARRVYGLAANKGKRAAYELSRRIERGEIKDGFTARDVYRRQWSLLTDREVVYMAIDELVEAGWLRRRRVDPTGGPNALSGRGRNEYIINPRARRN